MNKVITINLNGVAYQLEEGGYEALRAYLENAAQRLQGNPDRDEILTDIEQAIADKFRALLGAYKTVVNAKEVAAVLEAMGPVEGAEPAGAVGATAGTQAAGAASTPASGATAGPGTGGVRKLYRIYPEGAMLSGVCNGLGAYFGIDPTLFRLAFVLSGCLWGAGAVAYVAMVLIVPLAKTPAEKAAASGFAATAQEFIKRAREGYYEGMKSFHDHAAHRAWKRRFRHERRAWRHGFRRHMQEQGAHAAEAWQAQWAQHPPPFVGPVVIAPLLSILLFGAAIAMSYAIWALVRHGAAFGFVLPPTMPLWAGILLVVFAFVVVTWPIKALRWACYFPGPGRGWGDPAGALLGPLLALSLLAFGIWWCDRHVPEFHAWLAQLPALMRQFTDTVAGWFASKS